MIIGNDHKQVVENIHNAAREGRYHDKVEVNDPVFSPEKREEVMDNYLKKHNTLPFRFCQFIDRIMVNIATYHLTPRDKIVGYQNIANLKGGAVITCNHFNPSDNAIIRLMIRRAFHERLYIVSQDTNLNVPGLNGFLLKYTDIIPISGSMHYMNDYFAPTLSEMLIEKKQKILIYPEQEMWLNYRKPRPPERGAYYYAASNMVPIISCFAEILTLAQKQTKEFYRTRYVLHILPTIYPDPDKSVRENSCAMMEKDYAQKKDAYEKAYGKKLTYDVEDTDIAGYLNMV